MDVIATFTVDTLEGAAFRSFRQGIDSQRATKPTGLEWTEDGIDRFARWF